MTSSTVGHTPGPWKLFQFGGPQIGNANTGEAICTLWGNEKNENDSIHANARLIAAAPDLLAALKRILSAEEDGEGWTRAFIEAHAVIAKATGAA